MSENRPHLGRVCVVGMGVTGTAVARYLSEQGDRVDEVVTVEGDVTVEGKFDLIVISPGIAPHTPLFQSARDATDDLISEVEFAYRESANRWVAITGTNGKTTTTALATHLLLEGGADARAVGNIGVPAISALSQVDSDTILVAEVSSFQLETCRFFSPCVCAILNITPDHLNWHATMERYVDAKCAVLDNLDPGSLVLVDAHNDYFDRIYETAMLAGSTVRAIDSARLADDPLPALRIKGIHNVANALFAREIARYFEIDEEAIERGLSTFEAPRHRLQFAGIVGGAQWYNDSKATNPDATLKALHALEASRPLVLLGGRNKGSDMGPLACAVASVASGVVCFGEAGPEIAEAFTGDFAGNIIVVETMRDAMLWASAQSGVEVVLLSPACSSFDEFENFETRGEAFCAFVDQNSDAR